MSRTKKPEVFKDKPPTETWWKASPYLGTKLLKIEVAGMSPTRVNAVVQVGNLGWMYREYRLKTTDYTLFRRREDAEQFLINGHRARIKALKGIIKIEEAMIQAIENGEV